MLFELWQKHGKHVDIKHWRDERKSIASVYVDGEFVASGSSEHKECAKLDAAKVAVDKLSPSMGVNDESFEGVVLMDGSFHIEEAKQKLHEICDQKKWPRPICHIEKDEGPSHEKRFVSSVKIATIDGVLYMKGDEKSRVRDADNSAASLMIRALQEYRYI
ncbi:PREDICTED: ribonuclease [Prunus dulcis]|uniref:PREDICTED: ribonuclease n=1 Tax=Prunus dulcis TaxID=3755 RepID=A0A5E4FIV6_PRUDU|nr:ribonuclease 3-like protein 2 [Prunus dulcis]XP_034211721.1 ribonuclease 3-like protein 2 [Prunus dulcis]VVA25578.1 PREDICTED: ribonuclease [Prunus dulcis]